MTERYMDMLFGRMVDALLFEVAGGIAQPGEMVSPHVGPIEETILARPVTRAKNSNGRRRSARRLDRARDAHRRAA